MKLFFMILCCATFGITLAASDVLMYYDVLASKPEVEVQKGGNWNFNKSVGGAEFFMSPETRDCWVRIPVGLADAKVYDQFELKIKTDNPKSALVFEFNAAKPENALALKKNVFIQQGEHSYVFPWTHVGISVPPARLNLRMLNKQDNYHLPQSEMAHPLEFKYIRLNVTKEGVEKLHHDLKGIFSAEKYASAGTQARDAAKEICDYYLKEADGLFAVIYDKSQSEVKRLAALEKLYDIKRSAGWEVECAALNKSAGKVVIGWTGGADKIFRSRQFPGEFAGPAKLSLAQNETEGLQIALFPKENLKDVSAKVTQLNNNVGSVMDMEQINIAPLGYVRPRDAAYPNEFLNEWIPDPILMETAAMDLEKGYHQAYWIDVTALPGQAPGVYHGKVEFFANGKSIASIPLEVTVWNFALPEKLSFPSIISADYLRGISNFITTYSRDARAVAEWDKYMQIPGDVAPDASALSPAAKRLVDISWQTHELYRAHRISYSDIYRGIDRVVPNWVRRRIMEDDGLFCLGYDKGRDKLANLHIQLDSMRKDGNSERAYVYGYDEITHLKAFQGMSKSYKEIKKHFPEIKTAATSLDYTYGKDTGVGKELDIWIVPPTEYVESMEEVSEARKRGHEVWWYPCNWPFHPDANLLWENTATATRLIIGFMPWKFNVDGFLYYASTFWIGNRESDNWLGRWQTHGNVELEKYGTHDFDNEFRFKTTQDKRSAGIKQWATLNQKEPIPLTVEMNIEVIHMSADPKRKLFVEVKMNYTDKTSTKLTFPVDYSRIYPIKFSETIIPEKPVKNVFYAIWLEDNDGEIRVSDAALKQAGKTRTIRWRNPHIIVGGPLFDDLRYDVFSSNGDGSLFYPGLSGTLPSVRVKLLRDGREDYEYMVMLKQAINDVKSGARQVPDRNAWLVEAEKLLVVRPEVCSGLDAYARNGAPLLQYRQDIGNLLSQVK